MVSRAFALAVFALCGAGFVAGCASPVTNADGSLQYGDTRQFRLPSGMGLNVTREGGQARVLYPLEYPLTDAEAVAAGRFAPNEAAVEAQRAADPSLDHETPLSEVFEDQLACADIVLLSKADLAGEAGLAAARAVIEAETPRKLPIIAMTEGVVDPRVVLGLNAAAEDDLAARPSHHDGRDANGPRARK